MIVTSIMSIIVGLVLSLIAYISPAFSGVLTVSPSTGETLTQIFSLVAFFIPLDRLLPILVVFASIDGGLLAWRIAMRIKSFIPTMGD